MLNAPIEVVYLLFIFKVKLSTAIVQYTPHSNSLKKTSMCACV